MPITQEASLNVFDKPLDICSKDPVTGFFRNGSCDTCNDDEGSHTVCAIMTDEFLAFSKYLGNDDIIAPSDQANYLAQNYIQKTSLSRFFEVLKFKKLSKNFYFEFTDHMRAIHIKKN